MADNVQLDPATTDAPAQDEVPVNTYYLPDGTYVAEMADGTQYQYPPEPSEAGQPQQQEGQYGQYYQQPQQQYAASGYSGAANPMQQEFHPEAGYYQQHYDAAQGAAGGAPQGAAAINLASPAEGSRAAAAAHAGNSAAAADGSAAEGGSKKRKEKKRKDDGDGAAEADADDDNEAGNGISAPETIYTTSVQTSGYWVVDVLEEAYYSLAFKMWACQLFVTVWILTLFYGLNIEFGVLYRMIAVPRTDASDFWQSLGFACLFLAVSFFFATALAAQIAIVREIWTSTPRNTTIFGVSLSEANPPYAIHCVLVLVLTVVPLLWSIIYTASTLRTAAYFGQFFFFVSVLIAFICFLIIYTLMWVNAFRVKTLFYSMRVEEVEGARDFKRRHKHDDESSEEEEEEEESSEEESDDESDDEEGGRRRRRKNRRAKRAKKEKQKKDKKSRRTHVTGMHGKRLDSVSGFDSELTLQEFGINPRTVRWMIPIFAFGWLPVIIVTVAFVFDEAFPEWSLIWIFVGIIVFIAFIGLAEAATRLKVKSGTIVTIVFIIVFLALGLLATGLSGNPALIGIFFFFVIATHFLLLRKKPYEMLPHEIEAKFPSADHYGRHDPVDSYMCLCRNTILAFLRCCDACDPYQTFGKKAPEVRAYEKQFRHDHLALITDQRILLYKWVLLWILMAVGLSYGQQLSPVITEGVVADAPPTEGYNPSSWLCNVRYNTNYTADMELELANVTSYSMTNPVPLKASLGLKDLSYMNLATHVWGDPARAALRTILARYPQLLYSEGDVAGGLLEAVSRERIDWVEYRDNITNYRFINAYAFPRAVSLMRAIDAYGEWLALYVASAFSPFLSAWPLESQRNWIDGTMFLKRWMQGDILQYFEPLEQHIRNVLAEEPNRYGRRPQVLIFGGGFNGAFARAIARRTGVPSVTFSSAGTEMMHNAFDMNQDGQIMSGVNHIAVNTDRDAFTQFGGIGTDATFVTIPCDTSNDDRAFSPKCSQPQRMAAYLRMQCGDEIGVTVNPAIIDEV